MIIKGNLQIQCDQCGSRENFSASEADFSLEETDERQQGAEKRYQWDPEYDCQCGQTIEVDYEVWEYPSGHLNHEEIKVTGGTVIDKFTYDFADDNDMQDFDPNDFASEDFA